jgi:signal transduction histidine kinase
MNAMALWGRLYSGALRVPILMKIMGIAVGLTALLGVGMLWQIDETWHRMMLENKEEEGQRFGADLAAQSSELLLARDAVDLQHLLDDAQARYPGIAYLIVLDERRRRVADTLRGDPSADLLAANDVGPDGAPRVALLDTEIGGVRDVAVPILDGRAGVIRVGVSEASIDREVAWLTRRLGRVTAAIAALGIVAAWAVTRLLTRPIRELVALARAVQGGDFARRATVHVRDDVGELASTFNDMAAELAEKERTRKDLLRQVITAGENERKRVARELHDQTGQALVSLIAGLGAIEAERGADRNTERIAELRELATRTLGEVHDLSWTLRPSVLDDLGLMVALHRHAASFGKRFGVAIEIEELGFESAPRLPGEVEIAVYRIVQEALTNAARHGRARSIQVLLQRKAVSLLVIIEDDGVGFEPRRLQSKRARGERLGLLGVEERASLLGGTLRVESHPGSGTKLFVEIPVSNKESDAQDSSAHRG